jgi:hypothetical protein
MMMINPEVITGNFGAPKPAAYKASYEGGDDVVTSKVDSMSDMERGWAGWPGENTTGEIEQTPKLAAMSVIESYISRVPEMDVKFGNQTDDGENGLTINLRTEESAPLANNDILVAQYQAEFAVLIKSIQEQLSQHGLKNVKFEEVIVHVTPGMYRSAGQGAAMRQSMFTIEGQYKLYLN